ncbi:MAG: hypothetical protein ACRC8Y_02320 [Chroococcales cyanobacterium]
MPWDAPPYLLNSQGFCSGDRSNNRYYGNHIFLALHPIMPESVSQTSRLQEAIDTVESLSLEEQNLRVEILLKRLQRKRRENLRQDIEEVRHETAEGQIKFGSVEDFLKDLES